MAELPDLTESGAPAIAGGESAMKGRGFGGEDLAGQRFY